MDRNEEGIVWKLKLLWTCISYDVRSAVLCAKIMGCRIRSAIARKALEIIREDA